MDGSRDVPTPNLVGMLFYYAVSFVLSHITRIITVKAMKLCDKIPLRDAVYPLIRLFFTKSRRFLGFDSKR